MVKLLPSPSEAVTLNNEVGPGIVVADVGVECLGLGLLIDRGSGELDQSRLVVAVASVKQ